MRKISLLFAILLTTVSYTNAQYYLGPTDNGNPNGTNPEDLEYPTGGGLPNDWVVVKSGGQTTASWSTAQTMPFSFYFNGQAVTEFKVSTSGILTFSSTPGTAPSQINSSLPSSSIPDKSICVWGISGKGSNDKIVSKTFGTAPNRQLWISFNDFSLPSISNSHFTYWSIVIEETTNNIYIVDQRTSNSITPALTLGVQISSSIAINAIGTPTIGSLSNASPANADNVHYTFIQGTQPDRDIRGLGVNMAAIIETAANPHEVKFVLRNMGSDTITSLDFNYSMISSNKTSSTINNLNILPWQIDTLTHPLSWNPTVGEKLLKVWADNINGAADLNNANDTAFHNVTVIANFAQKIPLVESFTSSTCPQCKTVNQHIESTLDNQSLPYVHIKYPMSWPGSGDPYYTLEGGTRRQFYGITTVPYLYLNGVDWNSFNYILTSNTMANARTERSLVNMTATYYLNNQTICADIKIDPLVDINNPDLTLYVAIYEQKSVNNVKSNGEQEFFNIMKKMLPNANGTSVTNLISNTIQQENFCYTFNGTYKLPLNANSPINMGTNHTVEEFSDLRVAAWLQDDQTKEVIQVATAANSIGVFEEQQTQSPSVYPNPATDQIFVTSTVSTPQQVNTRLLDITGAEISNTNHGTKNGDIFIPLNLPNVAAGVYLLSIEIGSDTFIKRVIIQ